MELGGLGLEGWFGEAGYLKQYCSSKGHGVVDVISDIARVEVAVETYL
jgi:hypothetical protein